METLKEKSYKFVKEVKGEINEAENDVKNKIEIQKKKDERIKERVEGKVIDWKTKTEESKDKLEDKARG